ncbi:MAG: hypothetical protein ACFHVJ_15840 [Aestuariibacter sp.]
MFLIICSSASSALADDHIIEANIIRVEVCEEYDGVMVIYLAGVNGSAPVSGNGCVNNGVFPHIKLAKSREEFQSRQGMLSLALVAYTSNKRVALRYSDVTNELIAITLL